MYCEKKTLNSNQKVVIEMSIMKMRHNNCAVLRTISLNK